MLNHPEKSIESELDIIGLCRTLWKGKLWIIGGGVLFALIALLISFLLREEWGATAITDKPTINLLEKYYGQQQFLRSIYQATTPSSDELNVEGSAYYEFVTQLASYDTRRAFWLQSDYFQQGKEGDVKADAVRLETLIGDISVMPADENKKTKESIKLIAKSAEQANSLLRQYVVFANQRTVSHLNESLQGTWAAWQALLMSKIKRQEEMAAAIYHQEVASLKQGLKLAQQQGIEQARVDTLPAQLPTSDLFLLGRPLLQARLVALEAAGPSYDDEYYRNRVLLTTLKETPSLQSNFQTYRYLRTPEEPVTRESPRRLFLCIVWGIIGGLIGAGIVLVRRAYITPGK